MSSFSSAAQVLIAKKKLVNLVGFHNLPNQYHRKSIKKGFQFTLMVVGESGLGKSTLINTLFKTAVYPQKTDKEPSSETPKTIEIQSHSVELEEESVRLKLTCIDTPGFGDFVNNEDSWRPILENIEARFEAYLEQENRVNRKNMVDTRVHACLYFIAPTGHSLKALDIEFMKRLSSRVNLIPVIAKADTLTDDELEGFKHRILEDLAANNITIYKPQSYENDDPEIVQENNEILAKMPFAVVGSETTVGPNKVLGREYPWGVIEVENESHCDFVKLRYMLIRSHMEELKDHTNLVLYENYRIAKLNDPAYRGGFEASGPQSMASLSKFDQERSAHDQKMAKMEAEMKAVFQQKVLEKETKLKQSEDELYTRHREMKEQLERQRIELEERKKKLLAGGKSKSKGLFNKMYFKHKKFEIEAGKQRQIDDLFSQYDEAKLGRISAKDARLILREIEIDSMDAARLVAEADQEKRSVIKYEHFLEVLRMYMGERQAKAEMTMVFDTIRVTGRQPERAKLEFMRTGKKSVPAINGDEILRTAELLEEGLTEEDVKAMIELAEMDLEPKERTGQLTLEKFMSVMRQTAIW